MGVLADLRTVLAGAAGVTALVGTNPRSSDKAIRVDRLFQKDPNPAIELSLPEDDIQDDLAGDGATSNPLITLACVADTAQQAAALSKAVWPVLRDFRGATAGGFIDAIVLIDRRSGFAPAEDGSDGGDHVVELDVRCWYTEN